MTKDLFEDVIAQFRKQQAKGIAKYGVGVNPDSEDVLYWLKHLSDELTDATMYALATKAVLEKLLVRINELEEELESVREQNRELKGEAK